MPLGEVRRALTRALNGALALAEGTEGRADVGGGRWQVEKAAGLVFFDKLRAGVGQAIPPPHPHPSAHLSVRCVTRRDLKRRPTHSLSTCRLFSLARNLQLRPSQSSVPEPGGVILFCSIALTLPTLCLHVVSLVWVK